MELLRKTNMRIGLTGHTSGKNPPYPLVYL